MNTNNMLRVAEEGPADASDFYMKMKKEFSDYSQMNRLDINSPDVPKDERSWAENCEHCRVAMIKLVIHPGIVMTGMPETIYGMTTNRNQIPVWFNDWMLNPVVHMGNTGHGLWFCEKCSHIYAIIGGALWSQIKLNGEETFDGSKIKPFEVQKPKVVEEVIDPGIKTSEDATVCPNCKVWRTVEPYSETHIQHVCPKCRAVNLFKIQDIADKGA